MVQALGPRGWAVAPPAPSLKQAAVVSFSGPVLHTHTPPTHERHPPIGSSWQGRGCCPPHLGPLCLHGGRCWDQRGPPLPSGSPRSGDGGKRNIKGKKALMKHQPCTSAGCQGPGNHPSACSEPRQPAFNRKAQEKLILAVQRQYPVEQFTGAPAVGQHSISLSVTRAQPEDSLCLSLLQDGTTAGQH